MGKKKLTWFDNKTTYKFICNGNIIKIKKKTIYRYILRYNEVKYVNYFVDYNDMSFRQLLIAKLLSRGKTFARDAKGKEKRVTLLSLIMSTSKMKSIKQASKMKSIKQALKMKPIKHASKIIIHKFIETLNPIIADKLIEKVQEEIDELMYEDPQKIAHKSLDLSKPPVYMRTILTYNVCAGGSVGHIAGVLNNLGKFTAPPIFLTTDYLPTVKKEIETHIIKPKRKIKYSNELLYMDFNKTIVTESLKILKGIKPAFIYQRCSLFDYSGIKLSKHYRVPFIFEYNGSEVWVCRHWGNPLTFETLAYKIELCNLMIADLIIVVSKTLKCQLVERGIDPEKILLNPNGVEPTSYSPEIDGTEVRRKYNLDNKTVIGFIGTFGPWHGAEVLAEAFGELLNRYPEYKKTVRLLMVGDGATMHSVKKYINQYNVEAFSSFAGLIPQEKGPKYLAAADILVSSHVLNPDGTPFFGSPTKLFEYMAMGKGIIASDMDQIGEILEHKKTAWMVKPNNVDTLVEGLKVLIDDENLRTNMGESARKEVIAKYTWEDHTKKIIEKLKEIHELKNQVKAYWNRRACGTEGSSSVKYSRKYFDELEDYKYSLEPEIFSFTQFTRFHGKKILEVGIGTGTEFLQWVRAGAKAYGIDLTKEAVEHVKNRLYVYGLSAEEVRVADSENLPYADNTFDLVYSWGVIHHSPDTINALEEIIRVTGINGKIKIMIYNRRSLITFYLYLKHGLFAKKPFRTISDILYHHIESLGTKAYTINEVISILANYPVTIRKIDAKLRKVELQWINPKPVRVLLYMLGIFIGFDRVGYFMTIDIEKTGDLIVSKKNK